MGRATLVIMAAGLGSRFGEGIKSWSRWDPVERSLWTIPFMMHWKQDLIKWSL